MCFPSCAATIVCFFSEQKVISFVFFRKEEEENWSRVIWWNLLGMILAEINSPWQNLSTSAIGPSWKTSTGLWKFAYWPYRQGKTSEYP